MPSTEAREINERIALEIHGWEKRRMYLGTSYENTYYDAGGIFVPVWRYSPVDNMDEAMDAIYALLIQEEKWCRARPQSEPEEVRNAIPRYELLGRSDGTFSARVYCPIWYPMGDRRNTPSLAICDLLVKVMDHRKAHGVVVRDGVPIHLPSGEPS